LQSYPSVIFSYQPDNTWSCNNFPCHMESYCIWHWCKW